MGRKNKTADGGNVVNKDQVTVVGAGMMGPGIATSAALAGHSVVIVHRSPASADRAQRTIRRSLSQLLDGKLIRRNQVDRALEAVRLESDLKRGLQGSFWIIESINENLSEKQKLFKLIDAIVDPSVMLTSNTSGLCITDIAANVKHPERTATTHFWFPGHLVPLVEIVMGPKTEKSIADRLKTLLLDWGKAPVIVKKDWPGQLANRILQAVIREAVYIVESGLATAEDVDTAIKMGMGIRLPAWGPLEHIDAVGLDLALSVQSRVLPALYNEPGPGRRLKDLVDQGNLGYKTGSGFYDWKIKDMDSLSQTRDRFVMQTLRFFGANDPSKKRPVGG
jgi:3-hydroxybutyryl-CoA dehydrogenase